jgi:hypothetical protein
MGIIGITTILQVCYFSEFLFPFRTLFSPNNVDTFCFFFLVMFFFFGLLDTDN